jgi:hypothetical protein
MFNARQPSILERREDIMLVLIAMIVPIVTIASMLGL